MLEFHLLAAPPFVHWLLASQKHFVNHCRKWNAVLDACQGRSFSEMQKKKNQLGPACKRQEYISCFINPGGKESKSIISFI